MPQICKCCSHEDLDMIDAALLRGIGKRRIASQFGMSDKSVGRHEKNHLILQLAKAQEAGEMTDGDMLLEKIACLECDAQNIKKEYLDEKDKKGALTAIREIARLIELLAKIRGQIKETQPINIFMNPEWVNVQTLILETLDTYPEAKDTFIDRLGEFDEYEGTITQRLGSG